MWVYVFSFSLSLSLSLSLSQLLDTRVVSPFLRVNSNLIPLNNHLFESVSIVPELFSYLAPKFSFDRYNFRKNRRFRILPSSSRISFSPSSYRPPLSFHQIPPGFFVVPFLETEILAFFSTWRPNRVYPFH